MAEDTLEEALRFNYNLYFNQSHPLLIVQKMLKAVVDLFDPKLIDKYASDMASIILSFLFVKPKDMFNDDRQIEFTKFYFSSEYIRVVNRHLSNRHLETQEDQCQCAHWLMKNMCYLIHHGMMGDLFI